MLLGNYLEYLYIFLNSPLFRFCFMDNFPTLGDEGRELRKVFFDKIPVREIDDNLSNKFKQLLTNTSIKEFNNANHIVYYLYNLQEAEIKIIEKESY